MDSISLTAAEAARALAIRSVQIMGDGERGDFDAVIHPEATNRESRTEPPDTRGRGPAAYWATAIWLRTAYSDLRHTIDTAVVDGDLVVLHTTMHGRHTGPFVVYREDGLVDQVFPPTGRTFAVTQTHWLRIAEGRVIEHWANRDDLGQAVQLGWVPPTPGYLLRMARATRKAQRENGN
ncbi:ester cyclase [Nocardia sp. 2]|uniref:Ester cyclase n=1 Tax=Nocardia acididurans TaxID=2802282 RepID=A0ABS1M332_9NOCA|nr:ester cyclase [Nocardia acididurans]MBL1074229.1 ester cyclase [Nocardia acididurans]